MKYLLGFAAGFVLGGALAVAIVLFIPSSRPMLTPLDVSDGVQISLDFSAVADDMILFTNEGKSAIAPHPKGVMELWEPTITETSALSFSMPMNWFPIGGMTILSACGSTM